MSVEARDLEPLAHLARHLPAASASESEIRVRHAQPASRAL